MSKPWWHRTVWLFSGAVAVSASAASLYWYLYSRAATEHTMCERASDALGIIPASSSRQHAAASTSGQCGKQNGSSMGHAEAVGTPTAAAGHPPARFSSDSTCAESQHSSAAAVGQHSGLHAVATCPSSAAVDGTVPADTIQPFCAVAGQSADSTAAADAAAGSATSPFAAAAGDAGQNLQVVSPAKQAPTVSSCSSSSVRDTAPVSDQVAHTAGQAGEKGGLHSRDTAHSKQFDQLQGGQQAQQLEQHLPQQDELQQQQNLQQQGDLQQQEMLEQRQEEQDDQSQSCSAQAAISLHTPPPHQYEWQHPSLQQQQPFPTPPQSPRHVQPSGWEQQAGSQPQQHHPRTPEAQQQHLRQQQQSQPTQQHSSPELPGASPALQLTPRSSQDGVRHHRSFNTARHAPSLDTTVASAAVAHSLQLQYSPQLTQAGNIPAGAGAAAANVSAQGSAPVGTEGVGSNSSGAATEQRDAAVGHKGPPSLAASCASLCVQHCAKLMQDAAGRETTVLDIGCGTGGCCFELAASFSHVLGIDGDLLNITAAKELKAAGRLCFKPVADSAQQQAQQGHGQGTGSGEEQQEEGDEMCVVQVPEEVDRDRVRFWHCPLPKLPPKLAPVDAVLVEDVDGHLGSGLQSVCEQLPELVSPEGVCVVVVEGRVALEDVRTWLSDSRLQWMQEVELQYRSSGSSLQAAHAGVWLQP